MAESAYKNDMVHEEPPAYQAQDAISSSIQSAVVAGSGGFLMAAVQNTVQRQNVGAFGVMTKFGGTTATFSMQYWRLLHYRCGRLMGNSCRWRNIRFRQYCFGQLEGKGRFLGSGTRRGRRRGRPWFEECVSSPLIQPPTAHLFQIDQCHRLWAML